MVQFKLCRLFTIIGFNALFIHTAFAAQQENSLPFLPGLPDQTTMIAPAKNAAATPKNYILPATPATSQWGVFDSSQPPVLTIHSGDSVAIETMAASYNQVVPGSTIDQIIQIQTAVPNRGPHTLTGPIYVEGAEPGDTLRIHINKIVPRSYASNNTGPNKGLFPKEFSDLYVKYFYLDVKNKQMQFAPGIVVPLAPFPGIIAVAQEESGKFSSGPPGKFGGNLDLREMTEGSTLYLPVFKKGALVWTGDSHAGQGNGEIDLTAIETAFSELNVTIDVIKHETLTWPRVETANAWIAVGYDEDLNKAFNILKQETINLIMQKRSVNATEAAKILLTEWNCPIAEVVNGVKGTYCMVPKNSHAAKPAALLKNDNATYFATYAQDNDLQKAMEKASMAMIDKVVTIKKISRVDAYTLASLTMDCRIAPPASLSATENAIHCTMAKNLWVTKK